ncbi:MAG TPA: pepsin/retropepsin-like aspartic protease family protein [Candidatus Eremiobacteraceae bacterium]|jgi:hypothetical protein
MSTRAACAFAAAIIFISALPQTPARAKGVDTDPPPGIVPTTATLAQVLASHDKAVGKSKTPDAATIEGGAISEYGLTGTYSQITSGDDYAMTTTLGPFVTREGMRDRQPWSENENGEVVRVQGIHTSAAADDRALRAAMTSEVSGVMLLGEVSSPVSAYVVEVDPPGGRREWLFFDKATGQIDRTETLLATSRVVQTYSDFKARNGVTEAWSGHWSDGQPENDEDWHVTSLRAASGIDAAALDMPASRALVQFPTGVSSVDLPVSFVDGRVILRIMVGGKGYDLLLDSGTSDISIDRGAATAMGLKFYGQAQFASDGKFAVSKSIVPEIDVGTLKMSNVAVSVIPYSEFAKSGTEIVGLIGYDFIEGMVLRLDYDDRTATASVIGSYVPPPTSYVVPAALDDRVPIVAVQIGNAFGEHFVIDTGADLGYIFPGFAAAHPQDIADRGEGFMMTVNAPAMYAQGVAGVTQLKPTEVAVFRLGGVSFEQWVVYRMIADAKVGAEDDEYDGLIGYDFLKFFNVVFDYADGLVYLEPNHTFAGRVTHR